MNDKFESETFQMPSELQDVPTNYTMSHITYEDVNGILSLVEIALARGSIKGDELQILNQIRNDCLLEVQDYQAWVQKRQQVLAVEQQLMAEEAEARQAKEIEIAKATADAKVQSAQEAARLLQNRINELESQITARGITPVDGTTAQADDIISNFNPVDGNTSTSKAFENARAQNPTVPVKTNQPEFSDPVNASDTVTVNTPPTIDDQMLKATEIADGYTDEPLLTNPEFTVTTRGDSDADLSTETVTLTDNVEPLFKINIGQDGNVPLGEQVTDEDINMNTTEMDVDDFEPIEGDGEVEIEVREDPESIAEVQAMKEAVADEYEEIVIPNSMELQKMTKSKIAEVGKSLGFSISTVQTKDAMIKDFEENSWDLIQQAEEDENATVTQDEDIIRDGGYFGEDDS